MILRYWPARASSAVNTLKAERDPLTMEGTLLRNALTALYDDRPDDKDAARADDHRCHECERPLPLPSRRCAWCAKDDDA